MQPARHQRSRRRLSAAAVMAACLALWLASTFYSSALTHYAAQASCHGGLNKTALLADAVTVALYYCAVEAALSGVVALLLGRSRVLSEWSATHFQISRKPDLPEVLRSEPAAGPPPVAQTVILQAAATLCSVAAAFCNCDGHRVPPLNGLQPLITAALASLVHGEPVGASAPVALPFVSYVSVVLLAGTTSVKSKISCSTPVLTSIIAHGLRNLNIKRTYSYINSREQIGGDVEGKKLTYLLRTHAYSCFALLLLALATSSFGNSRLPPVDVALPGVLYAVCSFISLYFILQHLSVVSHATCQLFVNVVVGLAVLGAENQHLPLSTIVAAVAFLLGYFASVLKKTGEGCCGASARSKSVLLIALAVGFTCLGTMPESYAGGQQVVLAETVTLQPSANASSTSPAGEAKLEAIIKKQSAAELQAAESFDIVEQPDAASSHSNHLRTVDDLIAANRVWHDQVFGRVLSGIRRVVLVNMFTWDNKGDHLITMGELKILQRFNVSVVGSCYYWPTACKFDKMALDKDVAVVVQGGGYLGHEAHMNMFKNLCQGLLNNRIVIMPSSTCYPAASCTGLDKFADSLSKHGDLHILLRDMYSFSAIRPLFNSTRVQSYLVPDSAWAVTSLVADAVPVYDIVWLKRNDWETVRSDPLPRFPPDLRVQVAEWNDKWMGQDEKNYWEHLQLRTLSGVAFLARGRVVISDRLHAHIMCQLMRKPNVLVNSITRKQENYYTTWENSIHTSRLSNSNVQALADAVKLLSLHGGRVQVPNENPK